MVSVRQEKNAIFIHNSCAIVSVKAKQIRKTQILRIEEENKSIFCPNVHSISIPSNQSNDKKSTKRFDNNKKTVTATKKV